MERKTVKTMQGMTFSDGKEDAEIEDKPNEEDEGADDDDDGNDLQ